MQTRFQRPKEGSASSKVELVDLTTPVSPLKALVLNF